MESGGGNGEEMAPVAGRDPETGQFTKGYKGGPGRKGKKPAEGVPLAERMGRILTEELSDSELRKLLKDSPADYRRVMELAQKAGDAVKSSPEGDGSEVDRLRARVAELEAESVPADDGGMARARRLYDELLGADRE